MDSFDGLLTCCICLDRYRNPKLLPCQHTFCMEPCMEGLIDYVKRQVKCPECRAEHRIPYKGIQEFPSNVTMQRFLEMYQTISGELPDPNEGQIMERCAICNEKEFLQPCAHCDKKVCPDCKSAHVDVLKREVVRINNQVRRGIHKLHDILQGLGKSAGTVQQNCAAVREEVEGLGQRLIKAIRDRTEVLKSEVDVHMATEVSNLTTLKSNLEQEIANMESNSELAERHMGDSTDWDDAELMDAKDIFLKTVEFIRNFEQEAPSANDYRRPVRFNTSQDPNSLSRTLEQFGELNITRKELQDAVGVSNGNGFPALMPSSTSSGPGLMRSKSDHRLVAQFRQQEERYGDESGRSSPVARRRFGDRAGRRESTADHDEPSYDSPSERRHKYRSRFTRRNLDDDLDSYRPEPSAAAQEAAAADKKKEREKVLDTEDASRGALSGIVRIADVPRVIQKLADSERGPRKREEPKPAPAKASPAAPAAPSGPAPWRRQVSEDDEIAKIKKQNKEADTRCSRGGAAAAAAEETPSPRAASVSRSSVERRTSSQPTTPTSTMTRPRFSREESGSETEDSARRRPSRVSRPSAGAPISEAASEPRAPLTSAAQRKISEPIRGSSPRVAPVVSRSSSGGSLNREAEAAAVERPRPALRTTWERRGSRSNSSESTSSASESSASAARKGTGAAFSTNEIKSRFMRGAAPPAPPADPPRPRYGAGATAAPTSRPPVGTSSDSTHTPTRPRFQSRFLGRAGTPKAEDSTKSENSESSSESESDSSGSDSSSEDEPAAPSFRGRASNNMAKTSIGPLLARSALARKDSTSAADAPAPAVTPTSRPSRTSTLGSYGASRRESSVDYSAPSASSDRYPSRYSRDTTDVPSEPKPYESRYSSSRFSSDYTPTNGLARSRTSSHLESRSSAPDPDSYSSYSSKYSRPSRPSYDDYTPRYSSYSSRFLNRDEGSAAHQAPEEEATPPAGAATTPGPAAAVAGGSRTAGTSRYAPSGEERRSGRARSTSSEEADGRESGGRASPAPPCPPAQRRTSDSSAPGGEQAEPEADPGSKSEALSNWAQYLKNKYGYAGKDNERSKQGVSRSKSSHLLRLLPGAAPPHEDSASETGQVAPPSPTAGAVPLGCPARTQYLQKGRLRFKVGCRGGGPGQLTWPRGIAVGPDNAIVVADSSNHRVQVFDQQGTFVREFGQYGNGEAEFDCLAGVSVNRIGQFIISDRYNHRIQIFDPSGRFLRSFGQNGTMEGRFNYPWGVTTDALGFIYVCDKENHRVQVFQSDGTFVGTIGSEGRSSGQLAHPHYIAVSATNRVVVTDSNNHRVQVFDVNGKCLTTFGGEGGEEGKFKFPRGVAVDDQGYIVVGDSGNNRIQIFHPDGTFLKAFGGWGSQDGEFKGLEGVAVTSTGNILVCDRENHRVQAF